MTVGRGVIHNENPLPGTTAHALQLWVNLPASEKDGSAALPGSQKGEPSHATGAGCRDSPSIWQLRGVSSPKLNHVPVTVIDARVDDGATFEHELEADANAFLLHLEG
jgi:redox-sensitive bicupin YhaK (pirin superfamily)